MLKEVIKKIIFALAAPFFRNCFPKSNYWLAKKSLKPLSRFYGLDRGTPIDRFWIESFLRYYKDKIKGVCLEVGDNRYTRRLGGKRVTKSDVLDVDRNNSRANIYGDLHNLKKIISDNHYDCIILSHVLGYLDEPGQGIKECCRILKPGGTLLVTSACFAPVWDIEHTFWRFTPAGAKFLYRKFFDYQSLDIKSYGNVLSGQAFWVGLAQEELSKDELEYNDKHYPCILGVAATKRRDP